MALLEGADCHKKKLHESRDGWRILILFFKYLKSMYFAPLNNRNNLFVKICHIV